MILSELQTYINDQSKVSLAQMEVKFSIDATALRGMLSHLIHKGRVHKLSTPHRCHGCDICSPESLEFYEWVSPENMPQSKTSSETCGGACHVKSKPDALLA